MKKLLIFIGLILTLSLSGQRASFTGTVSSTQAVAGTPTNMISNGTFASGTDWTAEANWSIASNMATYDKLGNTALIQAAGDMNTAIEANTAYTLTFTVSGTTGGGIYMSIRIAAKTIIYVNIAEYNNGDKTINFTTPADIDTGGISFLPNTAGDSGGNISNVVLTPQ